MGTLSSGPISELPIQTKAKVRHVSEDNSEFTPLKCSGML